MRYDTTLKTLFQAPPPQLLQLLVGGQAHTMLTVEYPTVQMRRPDLVVRLTDGRLYHLELQSTNDPVMPWRMLEYFGLLCQHYGQPPLQQVLYVGEAPLTMPARLEYPTLSFQYESVRADRHPYPGWHGVAHQPVAGRQFTRPLVPSAESACGRPAPAGTHREPGGDSPRGCPGQTRDPGRAQAPPSCCTRGDPTDAHHH